MLPSLVLVCRPVVHQYTYICNLSIYALLLPSTATEAQGSVAAPLSTATRLVGFVSCLL